MKMSADTAAVMRKASAGPAALSLRQARVLPGPSLAKGGSFGALTVRQVLGPPLRPKMNAKQTLALRRAGFGAVDTRTAASAGAQAGAGYAASAGTSAIVTAAGYGAVAGPIGLVVGAIIGVVIGGLLKKNYLNVAEANAGADAAVHVFRQYQSIAGQVAGRQLGLAAMNAIWKGALYTGLFPLNNQQLCFHQGCLKYRGQPEWIEATINGPDNQFTLGGVYNQFLMAARAGASASPAAAGTQLVRTGIFSRGGMFRGLGAISGVPEAVVLVDNYLIPANTRDNPAWLVPRTPLEHQILYDTADAWLAEKHPELATTPFITNPPAAVPPLTTDSPGPINQPVTTPYAPSPIAVVPPSDVQPATMMTPIVGTGAGGGPVGYGMPGAPAQSPTVATASLGPAGGQSPLMLLLLAGAAFATVK
jgi:hypothetical protein